MALIGLLAAPAVAGAQAQERPLAVTQQVMTSSNEREGTISRTTGLYNGGNLRIFGMFDASQGEESRGRETNYFTLLAGHTELGRGFGAVGEFTKMKGEPAEIGFGAGYDFPQLPRRARLDVHAMPAVFNRDGFVRKAELDAYGGVELPRGFYLEGRSHLEFPYGAKREVHSELAVGKRIARGLALEAMGAYNGKGGGFRSDVRYVVPMPPAK